MDSMVMQLVFLSLVISLSSYLFAHHIRYRNQKGPTVWPFVGCLPQFAANGFKLYDWTTDEILKHGATIRYTFFFPVQSMNIVHTTEPGNVEYILRNNHTNFVLGRNIIEPLEAFLGNGIFNAEHDSWVLQRRIVRLMLGSNSFRKHVASFVKCSIEEDLFPFIQQMALNGTAVDMQDIMVKFSFDAMFHTTSGEKSNLLRYGTDCPDNAAVQAFRECFHEAAAMVTQRLHGPASLYKLKRFFNVGSERKLKQVMQYSDQFIENLIERRRKELQLDIGTDRLDLLTQLLLLQVQSHDEKSRLSEKQVKDLLINLMWAGSDTQAITLSWLLWLVSSHPEVEAKILEEIKAVRNHSTSSEEEKGRSAVSFSLAQISQMHYLHAAVSETLRLYPPVPWLGRVPGQDDVLPDGTAVYEGQFVVPNVYSMGRMPSIWGSDCRDFRPERWLRSGEFTAESPFKFAAFGGGSRICLGRELAAAQIKAVAATLISQFTFRPVPGHEVRTELNILLTMANGLWVTAHPRADVVVRKNLVVQLRY